MSDLETQRALTRRQARPQLVVTARGAVVREAVELESAELITLDRGDVVVVAEERFIGSKLRAKIVSPVVGWVSRRTLGLPEDRRHEEDELQTIVSTTGDYLPLLEVWVSHYSRHASTRRAGAVLHVLCLDAEAHEKVKAATRRPEWARFRVEVHAAPPAPPAGAETDSKTVQISRQMRRLAHFWKARLACVQEVLLAAPPGAPVVHSDADAFWIRDPLPDLLRRRRRAPKVGVGLNVQAERPAAAFSRDFGAWFEGEKGFGLCPGFYCLWASPEAHQLVRAWTRRLDVADAADDQKEVNNVYDAMNKTRRMREVVVLPYDKYQRCIRGRPTTGVPYVWHPYMERTFPPTPVADKVRVMGAIAAQLARGDLSTLDAFHSLLENGKDFQSRKAMQMEKMYGRRPFLTAEFFLDHETGRPHFALRSSVQVPGKDKPPALDSSGMLIGMVGIEDAAAAASRRVRLGDRLEAKAKSVKAAKTTDRGLGLPDRGGAGAKGGANPNAAADAGTDDGLPRRGSNVGTVRGPSGARLSRGALGKYQTLKRDEFARAAKMPAKQ